MARFLSITVAAACLGGGRLQAEPTKPQSIRVVMDNNYPPFTFMNVEGKLQGVLIDQWRLWEKKTGIKVELQGMDWVQALKRMKAGEFDVIDTIFRTEERAQYLRFTAGYQKIEVPIFFHKDISGITDARSLRGFPVGVKAGDAALDRLRDAGVETLLKFNSYEAVMRAAKERKVVVFVADQPPALYYLYKLGIANDFRRTAPLYVGEFHRAVARGRDDLLKIVEDGFAMISPAELKAIEEKWTGTAAFGRQSLRMLILVSVAAALLIGVLAVANGVLRRAVRRRTAALKASEARFRLLYERAPLPYQSLDANGRFIEVNQAWLDLLGYARDEVIGRYFGEFMTPESAELIKERLPRFKADGEIHGVEFEMICKDGGHRIVMYDGRIGQDEHGNFLQTHCVFADITARKQADAALRESEERYRRIVQTAEEGIWTIDAKARTAFVNPKMARMLGYTVEEMSGRALADFMDDEGRAIAEKNIQRRQQGISEQHEFKFLRKDGTELWVSLSTNPIFDASGTYAGALAMATDITARRQAERHIQHLNRVYAVLSDINQTIVRVREPQQIFSNACRIAVEQGGFSLAWIGLSDTPDSQPEIVAYAGVSADGLKKVEAVLGSAGCAFTARALQTGAHAVCNDIAHDPQAESWRSEAAQLGYRAMATFPLKAGEKVFGTFNFYADEAGFFDEDELRLLDELAMDISFAVEMIRHETERQRAEEALQTSEERFRQLTDNIREVLWLADPAKNEVLYISPAYERVWGRSCETLRASSQDWLESVHPEDRARVEEAQSRQLEGNYEEEYRIIWPDGTVRWIHSRAFPVQNTAGEVCRIAGVAEDVTERKAAEARIRQLAAFPELNPNPVLEFTRQGRLNYFNQAAVKLAQTLGCATVETILPPGAADIVRECLVSGQPRLRLETKHAARTLSWSFYPISTQHVVHCYVGDITDRMQLEAQFRQSQKMEAIGQLSSGVAHDFNNLLTAIKVHASLLTGDTRLAADTLESVKEIDRAADRAANLTRQLLLFSRKQVMTLRHVDLNELVGNMAKMLHRILSEDISIRLECTPGPLPLHADAGMLEQVIMNLAVNARDAMPKGGQLIIGTKAVELDALAAGRLPKARAGTYVCLTVQDTGTGIDPECLPQIFEPFFTTKETGKGTGLGLATVDGIVQQHQGWIDVESKLGRGSTFRIYLPQPQTTIKKAEPVARSASAVYAGHETILFVEDEPVLRTLVCTLLNRCGYRVLEAVSGLQALELWQKHRSAVQLLITDLVMPGGMSGFDLGDRLLQDEPRLPVIYISGYSPEIAGRHERLKEGVNFIAKPFDIDQLMTAVRLALKRAPA